MLLLSGLIVTLNFLLLHVTHAK